MKSRVAQVATFAGIFVAFVAITILVRGSTINTWTYLNQDEAELIAQARAAMLSPVPFSTWTLGTTGPIWVLFLALLGAIGLPLTIVFAHLLSAVFVGVLGFFAFVLLSRTYGRLTGIALAICWWLPIALIYPVGGDTNFGALETELLPSLLVLGAALIPASVLDKWPSLFLLLGLLCGLAVAAKYQILPVAAALLVIQIFGKARPWRQIASRAALFVAGAAVPIALIVVVMLISPTTSFDLVRQNLSFLGSYAGGVDLQSRIVNSTKLLLQPYLLAALLLLVRASVLSTRRVNVLRAVVVALGLSAVYAGGMGFGHYLIVLYVALVLALSLPIREGTAFVPAGVWRRLSPILIAVFVVFLIAFGVGTGRTGIAGPATVIRSLSASSVPRSEPLAEVCPEQSPVLVWGWAPELYVNYSWRNTVPFMNALGIVTNPALQRANESVIATAIDKSDCVIDAVGSPFFAFGPKMSLTTVYPRFVSVLDSEFISKKGLIDCVACTVYVRVSG